MGYFGRMIALIRFVLAILASLFKSKSRLEAENAALRQQLIVLGRKAGRRARLTNGDRWFFVQLYRWFPIDPRCPHDPSSPRLWCVGIGRPFVVIGIGNHAAEADRSFRRALIRQPAHKGPRVVEELIKAAGA
jgi:hypothetical protein